MLINPEDSACTSCGGTLQITGADEVQIEATCTACGKEHMVDPVQMGHAGQQYYEAALKTTDPQTYKWSQAWGAALRRTQSGKLAA